MQLIGYLTKLKKSIHARDPARLQLPPLPYFINFQEVQIPMYDQIQGGENKGIEGEG